MMMPVETHTSKDAVVEQFVVLKHEAELAVAAGMGMEEARLRYDLVFGSAVKSTEEDK